MNSLFLFLSLLALQCLQATSRVCHVDDESGLLSFKSGITHDPSGMLSSWKSGTDCCTWVGITCLYNDRVTALALYGQPDKSDSFLSGTISPSLAKLRDLDGIYLQNTRNISGKFPIFLYGMPKLLYVYMGYNQLSGRIPIDIGKLGTQLYALDLQGNKLTGSIPASISQLIGLNQLMLANNFITGKFPNGTRNLKNLTLIDLQNNQLSRPIPEIFSSLTQLWRLNLSGNHFSGKIPVSISSLSSRLIYLDLSHNLLTGEIPSYLGKFQALDTLNLAWNNLTGPVPTSFKNLTKIFNLDLSHNSLVNPFPVMNVRGIESLDLSYNKFRLGKIPNWVTSSPIIYSLKLAKCGIKINLTNWKPKEAYFYDYIDLSENQISGSPVSLLNRTSYLVEFRAAGNRLSFDLRKLIVSEKMKDLDLSRNSVFGGVPGWVSGLLSLNLSMNLLCGRIPATKFRASSFVGNRCLCGSPLADCKK
ncbi:DNA damage-repair/toleration protein DRT100 [Linum perenne]